MRCANCHTYIPKDRGIVIEDRYWFHRPYCYLAYYKAEWDGYGGWFITDADLNRLHALSGKEEDAAFQEIDARIKKQCADFDQDVLEAGIYNEARIHGMLASYWHALTHIKWERLILPQQYGEPVWGIVLTALAGSAITYLTPYLVVQAIGAVVIFWSGATLARYVATATHRAMLAEWLIFLGSQMTFHTLGYFIFAG